MNDIKTKYWHGVYDFAIAELKDPDQARAEADRAVELIGQGIRFEKAEQRRDKKQSSKMKFRKIVGVVLPWMTSFLIIGSIVTGIVVAAIAHEHTLANDYGGIDPAEVIDRANGAVMDYYTLDNGKEDKRLSSNLKLINKAHSYFVGTKAWKVTFKDRTGKLLCAFVWTNGYDNYHILKGDACK